MENEAMYGKDPIIEIRERIDLGNNQEFSFSLRVKESALEKAKKQISQLVQTLKK